MRLKRILALSALSAFLVFACSDDDETTPPADKGVPKDKSTTDGNKDGTTGDAKSGDAASTAPYIERMIPSDGFANGGKTGKGSTILLTGKNFKQGATVYIDGAPQAMVVSVASAVSMTFVMPKNEYGNKVRMADIMIFVNSEFSNTKTYTYTITKDMTADLKGSITTSSVEAYSDYESPTAFDGKVYVKGVTDTETTESKKIKAEIGFGKSGVNPTDTAGWMWFPATFSKVDSTTGYHHYSTKMKVPLAATYNVIYRFSYDPKGFGQFGEYIYADNDETDLKFDLTKVATIKATAAPADYCLKSSDCYDSLKVACKVSTTSWKLHKCVPCLAASDCVKNKNSYGNLCNTSTNACYCTADTDCKDKQLGYVCANKSSKGNVCGCTKDTNCPVGLKCQKTQSGATICGVPSP